MRHVYFTDAKSFKNTEVVELSSDRVLMKRERSTNSFDTYEPEVVSVNYIYREISKLGPITKFDQYLDQDTLYDVVRGSFIKNGKLYYFYFQGFKAGENFYKKVVDGNINALKLSGHEEVLSGYKDTVL